MGEEDWLEIGLGETDESQKNPAWLKTLFKGSYTPLQIYLTGVNLLLLIIMVLQPVSGITMSKHIFHFSGVGGMSFAQTVHLLLSHWGFVLMSVHVGNHVGVHRAEKKKGVAVILWTAAIAVSIYGACTACCPEKIAVKDFMRELAMQQCQYGSHPLYAGALK